MPGGPGPDSWSCSADGRKSAASTAWCAAFNEVSVRWTRNERSFAYVTTSAATNPIAARATTPRSSRARNDRRPSNLLPFRFEHVAGLAHRLDQRRAECIELAAQVADVRLDDIRVAAEVVAPHILEDLPLRQHPSWIQEEEAQQRELGCRQLDRRLASEHLVPTLVQHQVREAKDVARQLATGAPENRLHARDDLGQAERLRHIVVTAGTERVHLVLHRVLGGEEEDRRLEALLAQAAADLDPFDVRQHPVEDDQVGLEVANDAEGVPPVARLADVEALVAERGRDRVDDRALVVDDEDSTPARSVDPLHGSSHEPTVPRQAVNRLRNSTVRLWRPCEE